MCEYVQSIMVSFLLFPKPFTMLFAFGGLQVRYMIKVELFWMHADSNLELGSLFPGVCWYRFGNLLEKYCCHKHNGV